MPSSLLYCEQFYYPDGWGGAEIPRDITAYLAQQGWRVSVVCGTEQYAPASTTESGDPLPEGIFLLRVPRILPGKVHHLKLLRHLWFCVASMPLLMTGRHSVFVTQTNPPPIVPLIAVVAALRGVPHIIICQDLYPEILFAYGGLSSTGLAARLLKKTFRWAYGRASRVVTLGPCMTSVLRRKGIEAHRIVEIPNWATGPVDTIRGSANEIREDWKLDGKFVVLYSGNLGTAHDFETPLRAVALALSQVPNLVLVFVAGGSRLNDAKRLASELGIAEAVQFHPLVPANLLPHTFGVADVGLVTLRAEFAGLLVPSKLMGYLARGIPTLFVGPESDARSLVASAGSGASFTNGDAEGVAHWLRSLAGSPAKGSAFGLAGAHFYGQRLARDIALPRYAELVRDVERESIVESEQCE